jgi:integrase
MTSIASVAKDKSRAGWWRARWRDPDGNERSKRFRTRKEADAHVEQVRSTVISGTYVDPAASKRTFESYATEWAARQAHHRTGTAAKVESHLRLHVIPHLGRRPIGQLRRSELQAWLNALSAELAPATVHAIAAWTTTILRAAVEDGLIAKTPATKLKLPELPRRQVVPITRAQLDAMVGALPERYRAFAIVGASTGLRPGELLGLTVDRVDFLGRKVRVDRQLVTPPKGKPAFGPPKSRASVRVVPLPTVAAEALAEHLRVFGAGEHGLIFTTPAGRPFNRSWFGQIWTAAAASAGLPARTGPHALRHYYASVLITGGESVVVVQARLGHSSPVETLETYANLWPDSDDRTRAVIDAAFAPVVEPALGASGP